VSITAGFGFVAQADKFGRDISGDQYKNYTHLKHGDFAYNKGNSKKYPQGYVCQLTEFDQAAASSAFICFRLKEEYEANFLQGLFDQNIHGRQLSKHITSGARSDGLLNIRPEDFFSIKIPVPPQLAEQQKIARCLSSIDELTTAQAQKLDALKAHKKGLMRQLFPAEGETLPKLRFTEFWDAGEWEIKPLGEVGENLDSRRVPITEQDRVKGEIPYYGASGVIDFVKDFIFDEDLLCVSEDGANLVARTYPIAFSISGKTWVNNHAHVLRFKERSTQVIVENYLNSIKLNDFLTGMAQPKLNRAKLNIIPIPLPNLPEQQKIADCLSSIDELTTAQTQKLDALKAHKQGLMQQLFPALDEVNG
jgi:type I restriction enzyme S subunit